MSIKEKFSDDGTATPVNEKDFSKVIHLRVRETFSDPEHYGHPLHKLMELLSRQEFD